MISLICGIQSLNLFLRQKQTHRHRVVTRGERRWRRDKQEFGISRYKLLYIGLAKNFEFFHNILWKNSNKPFGQHNIKQISNKVLLYSAGNCIQFPVINHNGKEYTYICIHTYTYIYLNYFAILEKQHCKSTILQLKKYSRCS